MEVRKICQWCGKPFIAQKTTTCYCSHQCSNLGYKERIRERKRQLKRSQELLQPRQAAEGQDFFSFAQAAKLMGVTRQYIYKLVKESKLRASRISGKKSLIRRADIELMMKTKPYERIMPKEDFDISEYYTAEEIAEKYKVNAKWVWTYTRQHKVPKVRIRQFNYYSKKHIDAAFAKYEVDSDLTEWYTPEEIQEKYGMTRVAIRSQVYRNNIPSKKEHGQIYYSKLHFDLSKSSEQESKAEYYTVKEAMEKFKLSRAYDLARKGEEVNLKPKTLVIDEIELLECNLPEIKIRVVCSKGTYIRALARDIGEVPLCRATAYSMKMM